MRGNLVRHWGFFLPNLTIHHRMPYLNTCLVACSLSLLFVSCFTVKLRDLGALDSGRGYP